MYGISKKEEIMKVIVEFPMILSMIQFNPFLGKDIELYQQAFEKWYSKNYAPFTGKRNKKGEYNETLDTYVIINWIKEVAPEAMPIMLVEELDESQAEPSLPRMYF